VTPAAATALRTSGRPAFGDEAVTAGAAVDAQSRAWIERLRSSGPDRQAAEAELHALLLRGARFEIGRRQAALAHVRGEDLADLAHQAAGDAMVAVLAKLDDFRGNSRFTTWAYKFALLEAGVRLRRRAWQDREVSLEPEAWPEPPDTSGSVDEQAHVRELLAAIRDSIDGALTPHQRDVLTALALNGVPIDVLAERLATTRGALYKTLHDARRKLRADLKAKGFEAPGELNGRNQ
jgi:RNA polymerase sigma-70 factor, ECF subfamily